MEILVAKSGGFCHGVKKAVDTALSIDSENTYIYGEIIHNKEVDLHVHLYLIIDVIYIYNLSISYSNPNPGPMIIASATYMPLSVITL